MTVRDRLDRWRAADVISSGQCADLTAIASGARFSVYLELNALLYLGVVSLVGGIGWTIQTHFADLGDAAILGALTAALAASLFYCFSHASAYSSDQVPSPTFAFDYVLYLGCLVLGAELGYVEWRFGLLRAEWDVYLLASAIVFFWLAYRFDNRLVLSLALSTLAGWFGVRLSLMHLRLDLAGALRGSALVYGGLVAAAGLQLHRARVKPHFLEAYLQVAANAAFLALVSGADRGDPREPWLAGLVAASAVALWQGARFRRFSFVVYGVIYAYVGIGGEVLRHTTDFAGTLTYFVASATAVIAALAVISRRFGREE